MHTYGYKCPKCEEWHEREVPPERFEETYHAPCPFCDFVARRMPASVSILAQPAPRPEPVTTSA